MTKRQAKTHPRKRRLGRLGTVVIAIAILSGMDLKLSLLLWVAFSKSIWRNRREGSPDKKGEVASRKTDTSTSWEEMRQQAQDRGPDVASAMFQSESWTGIHCRGSGEELKQRSGLGVQTNILCPRILCHRMWRISLAWEYDLYYTSYLLKQHCPPRKRARPPYIDPSLLHTSLLPTPIQPML